MQLGNKVSQSLLSENPSAHTGSVFRSFLLANTPYKSMGRYFALIKQSPRTQHCVNRAHPVLLITAAPLDGATNSGTPGFYRVCGKL